MKKIVMGKKYILIKDYDTKDRYFPLRDSVKKGEIVMFEGKSLGFAHFRVIDIHSDKIRRITMSHKEAFKYLREVELI